MTVGNKTKVKEFILPVLIATAMCPLDFAILQLPHLWYCHLTFHMMTFDYVAAAVVVDCCEYLWLVLYATFDGNFESDYNNH